MNRGRIGLCIGVVSLAASVAVLLQARRIAHRTSPRTASSEDDELGDRFVLTHAPGDADQPEQVETGVDGYDVLGLIALTADDLASALRLSPEQSARVKEIVDATNQRIRQLLATPDARGRTPQAEIDRRREQARRILEACPRATETVCLYVRPVEFRDWRIEGRGTYDEEITSLTRKAHERIADQLDKEQRFRFGFADLRCLFPVPDGSGELK